MTSNQIAFYKAKTEAQHWRRQDKENRRHNKVTEGIGLGSNLITQEHYEREDAANLGHYIRMDTENQRHNIANESLTNAHYIRQDAINAYEAETGRINAETKVGEYQLEVERQPYQIELIKSQADSNDATASNKRAQIDVYTADAEKKRSETGYNKARTSKTKVDIAIDKTKFDVWGIEEPWRFIGEIGSSYSGIGLNVTKMITSIMPEVKGASGAKVGWK